MAIKVTIPAGQATVSVSGLFQWDYGRILEIESVDIGSEVLEIHFACEKMLEAIVRPCSFSNGVGTVTIPDVCLEQTTPITAWIYKIDGTEGRTVKTITLPITQRARPSVSREIPQEFSDKYTELITEINESVEKLEAGDITAALAKRSLSADHATTAGNANSAAYATSSGSANYSTDSGTATTAGYATLSGLVSGKLICEDPRYEELWSSVKIDSPGVYVVETWGELVNNSCALLLIPSLDSVVLTDELRYDSFEKRIYENSQSSPSRFIRSVYQIAKF